MRMSLQGEALTLLVVKGKIEVLGKILNLGKLVPARARLSFPVPRLSWCRYKHSGSLLHVVT